MLRQECSSNILNRQSSPYRQKIGYPKLPRRILHIIIHSGKMAMLSVFPGLPRPTGLRHLLHCLQLCGLNRFLECLLAYSTMCRVLPFMSPQSLHVRSCCHSTFRVMLAALLSNRLYYRSLQILQVGSLHSVGVEFPPTHVNSFHL